ncbi:hypothetical protein QQX98_005362 [Neonectria punicea]|uniref:BZIP transcription factor n=1 Tax=Neonectria punicea TaxID=979145 RepID=A0ABR1H542_9HYPO
MGSSTSGKPSACNVSEDTIKDRRLKKRELDRKAQRLARERTKNRMTHLEAMVTHLQQSDANSRVLSLTNHLSQVTSDRDKLLNALESLTFTIRSHIQDATRGAERVFPSTTVENGPALAPQSPDVTSPALPLDVHASSIPTADAPYDLLDPQMSANGKAGSSVVDRPSLRERFIFFQHRYCANLFWDLFVSNFRILWPFDFRDTYMRNAESGQFQLSPHFEQCLNELGAWTMKPDFFKQFPELYDDIPLYPES